MTRRTTAIVAALSLLPLGQPLLLGSTTALATAAVVLSTQGAHAQRAAYATYYNSGLAKGRSGNYQGAIADFNKAIAINPQNPTAPSNRGITKELIDDLTGACADWRKASSLGVQEAAGWVKDQCQ